jgi:hypothetical protein
MHAFAEFGRELIEDLAPRSRNCDRGALAVKAAVRPVSSNMLRP